MKGRLLLLVGIASAQDQKSDKNGGGVLDVLQGVLRVAVHDADVVVRGDDGRTYVLNTSGKTDDGQTLSVDTTGASGTSITPGDVVSITGKMDEQGRLRAELIQKDR